MNRTVTPRSFEGGADDPSSLTPRMTTTLTFAPGTGRPEACVDALEHVVELVAPGQLDEPVPPQRVERDVDPPQAGGDQVAGDRPGVAPLVVRARSTGGPVPPTRRAASLATSTGRWACTVARRR